MSTTVVRRLPAICLWPLVAALVSLAGCAVHATAKSAWAQGASRGQPYSTILVVGVGPNLNQRCAFERVLARRLRNEHTLVASSCDALKPKEPITRQGIEATIDELGIDAVVSTLLVNARSGGKGGGWGSDYGAYGEPLAPTSFAQATAVNPIDGNTAVTTRIVDARSARTLYTIDTLLKPNLTRDDGFLKMATAIADQLHDDGLIKADD